ncbi:hypothetical protein [Arenimonas fontis]|uniref:Uncharacterized protein n=1 Tax=Arenimonas fontis TaxID=2608255 RepID=A0A5B2ZF13_9GAMM|nr:hypothetical protein [Arenimonas fontis]KAA2285800.1 hypothetical protein F0415_04065 [Arenimonas fontis]
MRTSLLALLLAASGFAVHADDAMPADASSQAQAEEAVPVQAGQADQAAAKAGENRHDCLTQTGSRLKRRDRDGCISAPGQVITREDIDRSGAVDTADAVRRLTTRGTVRRGAASAGNP